METLTLAEVKAQNKANGYHFFDRSTMKFFASRIHGGLRQKKYFITSEKNGPNSLMRMFTIRCVGENFNILTVGKFQDYVSLDEAKDAIKKMEAR